jgi:hypothetical protein
MSSRHFIPVLCIGAVVFACGPRAHSESPATNGAQRSEIRLASKAIDTPLVSSSVTTPRPRDPKKPISAELQVMLDDGAVHMTLHVRNTSKKRVELTFPSGQTYDFVVLDSVGRELWRWANGRMFTQTLRNKQLAGGESIEMDERWKSPSLAPGRYTARALLTSENYPIVEQADFVVTGTTVASR